MARPKRGGRAKAKAASKDDEAAAAAAENAVKDEEEEPTGTRRSKRAKVESPPPAKAKPSKSKNAETKEEEDDAPSKSTATTKKSAATNKKRAANDDADADADTEKAEPKQGKKARKASAASSKDEDEAAIAIASIAKKQEESDKAAPQDDEKPAAKAKSKDSDKKDDEPASSDGKPPAQTNEGKTMKAQEKFDESWSEMMKQLSEYKKENGNTEVPMVSNQDEKYYELSKWVGKVRTQMKNYEQDEKQQKDSTAKSSTEKSSDAKKDDKDAKSSKEEEKDGKSEKDASKPAPKYNRAKTSSKSLLDESKVKELHDLGFTFKYKRGMKRKTPEEEANDFDTLCSLLGEYKVTGKSIKSHTKLQGWIAKQRKHYEEFKNNRTSSLTEERVKRLEDAGMNWNPKQTQTWDERAKAWKEYKDKNGSDPKRYSEDGLGKWVTEQRSKYKRYNLGQPTNLTSEQIETLTGWGFSFAPAITQPTNKAAPASWEERFKELLKWKGKLSILPIALLGLSAIELSWFLILYCVACYFVPTPFLDWVQIHINITRRGARALHGTATRKLLQQSIM